MLAAELMLLEQGFHDVRVFHFWMHGHAAWRSAGSVSNGTPLVGCKIIRRVCRRYRGLVVVGLLCVSSQAAADEGQAARADRAMAVSGGVNVIYNAVAKTCDPEYLYGSPQRPLASSARNAPPTPAELRTCAAIIHRYGPAIRCLRNRRVACLKRLRSSLCTRRTAPPLTLFTLFPSLPSLLGTPYEPAEST